MHTQLAKFHENVWITVLAPNGWKTQTICGLIEYAGRFVYLKNDGQDSTIAIYVCFLSINSFIFVYSFIVKHHFQETYMYKTFSINISGKNNPHPSMIPAEKCQVIHGWKVQKYLKSRWSTSQLSSHKTNLERFPKACVYFCSILVQHVSNIVLFSRSPSFWIHH